jgi:hypothetical protein
MVYLTLQKRVYENKVRRDFNITDMGKELNLLAEESGELCDAILQNNRAEITDAIGDLMVYCLGLCEMFKFNSDETITLVSEPPESLAGYALHTGREVGMLAKTYKRSNKKPVNEIDQREEFALHIGRLMGVCSSMFTFIGENEMQVLEQIITANETRTHQGQA